MPQISTLPSQVADLCALAWLCLVAGVCQALESSLESTFSKVDSVSGIHSDDLAKFRATADRKSSSTLNFAKSLTSNTTIPRILEEEKQAGRENAAQNLESQSGLVQGVSTQAGFFSKKPTPKQQPKDSRNEAPFLSLRENPQGFSWQSISAQADSKQNAQNLTTPQAEAKVDSRSETQSAANSAQDSRSFTQNAKNLSKPQAEAKLDSIDCHDFARAKSRNDGKNAASKKVDSRNEAQNLNKSAKDSRILDEKCGLQGKSQGSYLDGDLWDFSPLPHFSLKAQSSNNAENMFCSHATRRQDLR